MAETEAAQDGAGTRARLGLWSCMALVVGNVIGVGIFALPASLAAFGGLALAGWLLTASGALVLALVFARLSQLVPKAGGPYAYTRAGFGDFTGFLIAWGYWIGLWSSVAALAVGTMNYVGAGARAAGMDAVLAGAIAIGGLWLVTWFNLRGVEGAGRFQMITTVLKLIPLVAIGTIGLLAADWSYFAPIVPDAYPSAFSAVVAAAALTMYSFLGIESATIIADNVDQPTRTVPRATVLGTLVTAVVYIMSTIGVMGALPPAALGASAAPYADAAAALWGPWAATVVTIGVVIAGVGALNGFVLLQGHVPMAAAQDRLFPARFARRSRTGVPAFGCVFSSLLATAVLLVYYGGLSSGATGLVEAYNTIILLATFTTLVPYAFCAVAELLVYFQDRPRYSGRRLRGAAPIAALAFAFAFLTIVGSGAQTVLYGFAFLLLGVPVYVWMRKVEAAARPEPAGDDAPAVVPEVDDSPAPAAGPAFAG
jgi:basic amino acid/polyamine antiporter, APA family